MTVDRPLSLRLPCDGWKLRESKINQSFLFILQLDALGPAINVLMRDLSESTTQEKAVEIFKAAVEVHLF